MHLMLVGWNETSAWPPEFRMRRRQIGLRRYDDYLSFFPMTEDSEELWRSCVRWLMDLNVIDRTSIQELNVQTFASLLRDGMVLCKTAEMLCPGSITTPPESQKTNYPSQFISSKNISIFLAACRTTFNIPECFLFEPIDLFNFIDFAKVLHTLSQLSHTVYSKSRNIRPFPEKSLSEGATASQCFPPRSQVGEEEIYRNLNEEVDKVDVDTAIYGDINRNNDEQHIIYEHLVNRRDSQRKQDDWYKFVPSTKREYSIKELLDTETNYVDKALQMIMNRLYSPLKQHLKEEDHKTIFINISELYDLHQKFHNDLRQSVLRTLGLNESSNGRPTSLGKTIGDIFLMYKDKFIAYGPYCMKIEESRERIFQLEKSDPTAKAKIAECTSANDNQFKLQDLLCLPMQRVLKYSLLLQELLKHTPIESPDRKSLDVAKEAMDDINSYINEMKRDHEMVQFIEEVEKSISDLTMPPGVRLSDYGRLNLDGEVRLLETYTSHSGKMKQRYVFIFDKVIIICQANRNNTYKYKNAHILYDFSISQDSSIPSGGTITKKLLANNHQHILHLHRAKAPPEKDPVTQIAMAFKSDAQKQRWMQQFELSKTNVSPAEANQVTGHYFHYISFSTDKATYCSVCAKLFKGLFFQGYECNACHRWYHRQCLTLEKCHALRNNRISNGHSFNRQKSSPIVSLSKGDTVIALRSVNPSDITYLPFSKEDIIQVEEVLTDSTFVGSLKTNPSRTGIVSMDCVKKMRISTCNMITGVERKDSTVLPEPRKLLRPSSSFAAQEYVNTEIAGQSWFMGEMERADAEAKLKGTPNGTYLVRYSPNRATYAISISYQDEVKHMIIEVNDSQQYYLDDGYNFNSIVELINYYKAHNLIEIFNSLNTTLKNAYRDCKIYKVIHDYEGPEQKFLTIRKGDLVTLVDTIGEDRGWWKVMLNNRVGFAPLSYMVALDE